MDLNIAFVRNAFFDEKLLHVLPLVAGQNEELLLSLAGPIAVELLINKLF